VIEEALRLCQYNTPSFPCRADKSPACPHGFKDATADPDKLKDLWQAFPGPLVGVPTGEVSGIFVVDIDSARHDEANDWLECWSPYLPETRQHYTKSGGWHLLFKHQAGLKNTASKLAKGVDTRGDGGYIIWWPFHLGLNAPHKLDLPLCDLPEVLVERLKLIVVPAVARLPAWKTASSLPIGDPNNKIEGILAAVSRAQQGKRNDLLFWGACKIDSMLERGEIGPEEGTNSLQALSIISINAGLSPHEVARTIRSAVK
jgi:hypothetical protein